MAEQWLILKDYATTLGISEAAVRKAIKTGRIPETATKREKRTQGRPYVLINKRLADLSWYHNTTPTKGGETSRKAQQKIAPTVGSIPVHEVTFEEQYEVSLNEATRRERVAKAALAQLELTELQKSLIRKEVIYKELFETSKRLHDAIMGIPDRIVAEVAAAGSDRNLINKILTDALATALEALADAHKAE